MFFIKNRLKNNESGFVMIPTILGSAVIVVLLTAVIASVNSSLDTTRRSTDYQTASVLAQDASNNFFSYLEANPNYLNTGDYANPSNDPALGGTWNNLSGSVPTGADTTTSDIGQGTWVTVNPSTGQIGTSYTQNGTTYSCTNWTADCYQLTVSYTNTAGNATAGTGSSGTVQTSAGSSSNGTGGTGNVSTYNESATIEVDVRVACHGQNPNSQNSVCIQARYQQTFQRRTFLDYLYFTNNESTLDPNFLSSGICGGSCEPPNFYTQDPAYVGDGGTCSTDGIASDNGTDCIDGPLYTNSNNIWYCGSPVFMGTVQIGGNFSSPGYFHPPNSQQYQCNLSGTPSFNQGNPTNTQATPLPTPSDDAYLNTIAQATGGYYSSDQTFVLGGSPTSPTINGLPYPLSNVIYVNGNITLSTASGAMYGQLTIVASGNITINGNMYYGCDTSASDPTYGTHYVIAPGCTDMLGVITTGSNTYINIPYNSTNNNETIDAALMSVNGSIDSSNWITPCGGNINPTVDKCPVLFFDGAMVSNYRGVFGAYVGDGINGLPSGNNAFGGASYGYIKGFEYDIRLENTQPPYFIQPVAGVWNRNNLAELPAGQPGLGS